MIWYECRHILTFRTDFLVIKGEGGPDFFIDMYPKEADWWANDHTVWGEIVDEDSLIVADSVFEEPAERNEKVDITYLNEQIHIDIL